MDHAALLAALTYDPDTGEFHRRLTGKRADRPSSNGYRRVTVLGRTTPAHVLANFYMTGKWSEIVDHADEDRANNRWANLRATTRSGNVHAVHARRGGSGVWLTPSGRWRGRLTICGVQHCEFFATEDEARNFVDTLRRNHLDSLALSY